MVQWNFNWKLTLQLHYLLYHLWYEIKDTDFYSAFCLYRKRTRRNASILKFILVLVHMGWTSQPQHNLKIETQAMGAAIDLTKGGAMLIPSKYLPAITLTGLTWDRKSTRLNSSHQIISYAVFCLKKKKVTIVWHVFPNTASSVYISTTFVNP